MSLLMLFQSFLKMEDDGSRVDCLRKANLCLPPGSRDGLASPQSPHSEHSPPPCLSCPTPPTLATGGSQSYMSSSQKRADGFPTC